MIHPKYLLPIALLLLGQLASAEPESEVAKDVEQVLQSDAEAPSCDLREDEPLAIDIESNGYHVQFPYFKPEFTSLDEDFRKILVEDDHELLGYFKRILLEKVGVKKSFFGFVSKVGQTVSFIATLRSLGNKMWDRQGKYLTKLEHNKAFARTAGPLFKEVLDESKKLPPAKTDAASLKKETENLLGAVLEGFSASPVAHFVDFSCGTINGKPFKQELTKLVSKLRNNGCSSTMGLVDWVINWSTGKGTGDEIASDA